MIKRNTDINTPGSKWREERKTVDYTIGTSYRRNIASSIPFIAAVFAATLLLVLPSSCTPGENNVVKVDSLPDIYPDYKGVTLPCSIAPPNFKVTGADRVTVTFTSNRGGFPVKSRYAAIPRRKWHKMIREEPNGDITVTVRARCEGIWKEWLPFTIHISSDPIDGTLVYRRVDPGYELYARMGIYQRDLSTFRERAVFENRKVSPGCVNCHSFARCDRSNAQLHFRGKNGGTLIFKDGDQKIYDMTNPLTLGTVYPYWHPDGRYVAYSVNRIVQSFHNIPGKVLDVYDTASDIVVYDTETETVMAYPTLQDSSRFETFPAFSPDGRTLYFCSTKAERNFEETRYELCSVEFSPEDGSISDTIRTLWSDSKLSASFPRPSYDGRFILFTVSGYGTFPIWHSEADLWKLDLLSGKSAPAEELNSPDTESYHSWSSNSRWIVFSSRRDDGRYTRLYLSHRNDDGTFSKPFLLPQRNPDDNILLLQSYNIPEFCNGEFAIDKSKVYRSERRKVKALKKESDRHPRSCDNS